MKAALLVTWCQHVTYIKPDSTKQQGHITVFDSQIVQLIHFLDA